MNEHSHGNNEITVLTFTPDQKCEVESNDTGLKYNEVKVLFQKAHM